MTLKECILIGNRCYKANNKMTNGKPTGIVVHSTGADNPNLCRYVQPLTSQPYYAEVIADLGTNKYGNHWNSETRAACVHAFIGVNAAGEVETYKTLPFDICCWGVGNGTKGSYNYNPNARLQFEICEDGLTDEEYFNAVFKEAAELCACWCKAYGFGVDKICSHYESYKQGYGGNHGDCDHWLKKFGKDMNWFRNQVKALLGGDDETSTETKGDICMCELPILKKGSKNGSVQTLQHLLNVYNKAGLVTDGDFGRKTETALIEYQKSRGLVADGVCGKATWERIIK